MDIKIIATSSFLIVILILLAPLGFAIGNWALAQDDSLLTKASLARHYLSEAREAMQRGNTTEAIIHIDLADQQLLSIIQNSSSKLNIDNSSLR